MERLKMAQEKNWKGTLNLPRTKFPMRANLPQREPQMLQRWEKLGLYHKIVDARRDAGRFTLHDGPPYANGHIHHGHILNKILKDVVIKYRSMSGYLSENIPGWDCHGLPVEHEVDKKLGSKRQGMTQLDIRRACREYAERFVEIQKEEFARLGVLADWENAYTTLDHYYESTVVRELGRMVEKGMVYKDLKPVHWSYAAGSALAEAEVEYKAFEAPSIYVKFPFDAPPPLIKDAAGDRPVFVVIWTTTPWTLPANLAIALHPFFDYVLVDVEGEALVLAEGLADSVYRECGIESAQELARFEGRELVGTEAAPLRPAARHPFIDRPSVLLPADYVTLDQGTGCVHTAPGHGQEDHMLGQFFGLDIVSPVDEGGRFTGEVPEYEGVHVFDANPRIVERLADIGALLNAVGESVVIERYPHCWRTKQPVIFRATPQWFVHVDDANALRQKAIGAVDETRWIPAWGEDRIRGMLEHRPDWCISRQRVWGVPIPALQCSSCGEDVLHHSVVYRLADIATEEGVDAWFVRPVEELVPEGFRCPECGGDAFAKETDILDVWFESGSSFAAVLERREGLEPVADLYLEGSDQHRGWFQSSLLIGIGAHGHAPYRAVLTHGFVVDEEGRKYSKSSANYEKPEKLLKTLGAEILRLWVAAVDYRADIALSQQILQRMVDAYRRIRNTARFLLGNLQDFDPATDQVPLDRLPELDRWALDNLARLVDRLGRAYEDYEFHVVFHRLLEYCTVDLSQNYLDPLKDRLYCELPDDSRRRASQTVMYEILHAMARLAAPILSFTADEIWQQMRHADNPGADSAESVHLARFPTPQPEWLDEGVGQLFETLLPIRGRVQEAIAARRPTTKGERQPGQIGSSQEAAVRLAVDDRLRALLEPRLGLCEELFIVSKVTLADGALEDGLPAVTVELAAGEKCPRCWNYRTEFGLDGEYPDLCRRCAGVVRELEAADA
jgi:isoleucyl-tRNA synthetase